MYDIVLILLWLTGLVTTAVAIWGPDPEVTVFAAVANIAIWAVIAFGVDAVQTAQGATFAHPGVSILAFGNSAFSAIPLLVGIMEWYEDSSGQDAGTQAAQETLAEMEENQI